MNFLDQVTSFSAINHVWLGALCLVLAAWFRFIAVINLGVWQGIFDPVQPRLQADPPPVSRVRAGVMGCLTGSIANLFAWGLFLEGLDLLVFAGGLTKWGFELLGL